MFSAPLKHALSPHKGPVESFFNSIQIPLSALCRVITTMGAARMEIQVKTFLPCILEWSGDVLSRVVTSGVVRSWNVISFE